MSPAPVMKLPTNWQRERSTAKVRQIVVITIMTTETVAAIMVLVTKSTGLTVMCIVTMTKNMDITGMDMAADTVTVEAPRGSIVYRLVKIER